MLDEYSDTSFLNFALDFQADPGQLSRLAEAAQACFEAIAANNFGGNWNLVVCRNQAEGSAISVSPGRIGVQTLTTERWRARSEAILAGVAVAARVLGCQSARRAIMRVVTFSPVDMTHQELVTLFFGTYLPAVADLNGETHGEICDTLVQLYGRHRNFDYKLGLAPQTPDQAFQQVTRETNLIENLAPSRFDDEAFTRLTQRVKRVVLNVEVEVWRERQPIADLPLFTRDALAAIDALGNTSIGNIRGIPAVLR